MTATQYIAKTDIAKKIASLQNELLIAKAGVGALVGVTLLSSFACDWTLTLFSLGAITIALIAARMTECQIDKLNEQIFQLRIK